MKSWIKFNHDSTEHQEMLDNFFNLPDLPKAVSNRKELKIEEFKDHPASELYIFVDDETNEMLGCCGFFVTFDDHGIEYCKSPYRLYVASKATGAYTISRTNWENITRDWLSRWPNIPFLATVNVGNEKILFYENRGMKRYCDSLDPSDPFLKNQMSFYLHPKLVYEMYTWQYAYYTTPYIGKFIREEKDMDPEIKAKIEKEWADGYWLGSCGRNKLE